MKSLFLARGRIGRLNFFGCNLAIIAVMIATGAMMAVIGGSGHPAAAIFLLFPCFVSMVWISVCLQIRRLHDLDLSGWWTLGILALSLVVAGIDVGMDRTLLGPLFQIAVTVGLYVWPGTRGPNRYGPPPGVEQAAPAPAASGLA